MKPAATERASRLTVAERQAEVARLYPTGKHTMQELAELLGVGTMTVSRDVAALELPTRLRPNRSPRRRARVYARRAKAQPSVELVCDTCGEPFKRFKSQTVNARTGQPFLRHFCSMTCRNDALPERGRFVPCAWCGREVYRVPAELDHDHTCCSRTCTARLRGDRLGLPQFVAPNWSGTARRIRKLKWAPKPGRRRNDARLDYEDALERIRDEYRKTHGSERDLQRATGESRRMVRIALGRPV
jgi:hypothetical protein